MNSDVIITVLGSVMSLLLVVNAFFTRKTLEAIAKIDVNLAVYMSKHDNTEEMSRWNRHEVMKLRDRVHSLEGGQTQLLIYMKDNLAKEN